MIYTVGKVPESHQYVQTKFTHFLDWIKVQIAYQLDLETNITRTALGRIIRTIQFGEVRTEFSEPGIRFVLIWDDLSTLEKDQIIAILCNHKQQKFIHNASFEYQTLLNYGAVLENVVDTMLQEQTKWAGYFTGEANENGDSFFSLAGTLYRYFEMVLDKSYQAAFVPGIELTPGHIVYAADDVTHLDLLNKVQLTFLKNEGLMNVRNLENEAVLAFSDISWNGMLLDKEKWIDNVSKAQPVVDQYRAALNQWLFNDPILNQYAREHELICTEDTVTFNKNSPNQKLELVQKLFPDIIGATKPIIKKYLKDRTDLTEEQRRMMESMFEGDYTLAYVHLAHYHREWLIEKGYLRPEGDIQLNWNSVDVVLPMFQKLDKKLKDLSEKSRNNFAHPIVSDYEKFKKSLKLLTSFGMKFLEFVDMDGKVRTTFNQVLNTGRVSSKQPNMQQLPNLDEEGPDPYRYRNAFLPSDPDFVIVASDYISQELVTIAEISQDPVWLDAIANGKDLHSVCAHLVFGKKWEDGTEKDCAYFKLVDGKPQQKKCKCKKHKNLRYSTKSIDFGLAYGMSVYKLAGDLHISVKEAEVIMSDYFTVFPKIGQCLTNFGGYGVQLGYIKTLAPFNRKRWFPDWDKVQDRIEYHIKRIQYNGILGTIERASKNLPIQGSCADMTKYALVLIRRYINDNGLRHKIRIIAQIHDEVTTECHKDFAEEWSGILTTLMERAGKLVIKSGILKADTSISEVWSK